MTAHAYLEQHESGPRFVDVTQEDTRLIVRSGRLGGAGDVRVLQVQTDSDAKRAFQRQLVRLERKRFWHGYHEPSLVAAIQASPNDAGRYQVYADWLLERQDARGELITAMAVGNGQRAMDLLAQHSAQLQPAWWAGEKIAMRWSLGFLYQATFGDCHDPYVFRRVLRHPSAIAIREVRLQTALPRPSINPQYFDCDTSEWQSVIGERPRSLTKIEVPPRHPMLLVKDVGLDIVVAMAGG